MTIAPDYGIERFYLPEGEGMAIQNDMRVRPFGIRACARRRRHRADQGADGWRHDAVRGTALLRRVAFEGIHATRFKSLFLCMSLSQNRCALLGDMH